MIDRAPKITWRSVREAVVETDGEIEYHVDGEPGVADRRLDITVKPGALDRDARYLESRQVRS